MMKQIFSPKDGSERLGYAFRAVPMLKRRCCPGLLVAIASFVAGMAVDANGQGKAEVVVPVNQTAPVGPDGAGPDGPRAIFLEARTAPPPPPVFFSARVTAKAMALSCSS